MRPHASRSGWRHGASKQPRKELILMNHHRLKCYCILLDVAKKLPTLVQSLPRGEAYLIDQLKRALSSAILNLSEGNGRIYYKERRRFFNISTASIAECMSCLDILLSYNLISDSLYSEICSDLKMSYAMIRKLSLVLGSRF